MDSSASTSATPDWPVYYEVHASQQEEDATSQREIDAGPSDAGPSDRIPLLPVSQLQAIADLVLQQLAPSLTVRNASSPSSFFSVPNDGTLVQMSSTPATVLLATASSAMLALLAV